MSYQLERLGTFLGPNPDNAWEAGGAFNPGLLMDGNDIVFTYRGVPVDGSNGTFKPTIYMSSIGHGKLEFDEKTREFSVWRSEDPLLSPTERYERGMGCEDGGRMGKIGNTYFLPYTAVGLENDKLTIQLALATSKDGKKWDKQGIICPNESAKAAAIFPVGDGGCGMYFTIWPDSPRSSIMYAEFKNLDELINPPEGYWENFIQNYDSNVLVQPSPGARRGPEIGSPPIKSNIGNILIFCPENNTDHDQWNIGAAVVDPCNPKEIISQTTEPLLKAETDEEVHGPVCKNCVFPGGSVVVGETLLVAHGIGDTHSGLAIGNFNELLTALS